MPFAATLDELAQQFAPFVYFHSAEGNMPCSTNWYLPQVGYTHVVNGVQTTFQPGATGWTPLVSFPYPNADVGDCLFIPGDVVSSEDPPGPAATIRAGNPATATAYVHAVPVTEDADGNPVEWLDLQYWFFYAFNGAESVAAQEWGAHESSRTNMSNHEADWEHVVVRIDTSCTVVGVFFAQHDWGEWVPSAAQDPDNGYTLTNGSQVVVYAALGSHASYPTAGGPFWIAHQGKLGIDFGLADFTEASSKIVDYAEDGRTVIVRNDATQWFDYATPSLPWMSFAGLWGARATVPLTPTDIVNGILGVIADWPFVSSLQDLVQSLGDEIAVTLTDWNADGPANLPYQGGWNPQFAITAGAYASGTWTPFPAPPVGTRSALACATEDTGTGTLIHAAYVGTDGYVRYIQYDGSGWGYAGTTIAGQTATNSPAVAVLNGTVYCVFQNNAELYYATATGPEYEFGPAQRMNNPGICDYTSPALFVQYGIVYCLYQDYGGPNEGNSTLRCLAYIAAQDHWIDQSPTASGYPGMANSPAAALTNSATVCVVYQGYHKNQQLWGTSRNGSSWQPLPAGSLPAMSASPGAASAGPVLYAAYFSVNRSQLNLVQFSDQAWQLVSASPTNAVAGCSPTLIAYNGQLVAFYQTMS
jgi:hypothetical protein